MKTKFLFSNRLKLWAWIIFIPSVILGVLLALNFIDEPKFLDVKVFALLADDMSIPTDEGNLSIIKNNIIDEILSVCIIVSGLILGFSKTKMEDEYIAYLRGDALKWSFYINYGILLLAILFVYGFSFLTVMIFSLVFNLILFVLLFHYKLFQLNKQVNVEE